MDTGDLNIEGTVTGLTKSEITTALGYTPVESVSGTSGHITSTGGTTPVLDLATTAVTPGSYTLSSITVDAYGRLTAASSHTLTSGDITTALTYTPSKQAPTPTSGDIATVDGSGNVTDSGKSFSTDGTLASDSDSLIPTQKAIKTYITSNGSGNSGGMTLVATASPSGASTITISSLSAGRYLLVSSITQTTSAGNLQIRFNGDSGTNYAFQDIYCYSSVGTDGPETGKTSINLGTFGIAAGQTSQVICYITTNGNNVQIYNTQWGYSNLSAYGLGLIGGTYDGSATLSSITVLTSAGTMNGTLSLYQLE